MAKTGRPLVTIIAPTAPAALLTAKIFINYIIELPSQKTPPLSKTQKQQRCKVMPSKKQVIKTYLTNEEYGEIQAQAEKAGLSLSKFVSRVSLGYQVPSLENQQARRELLKINADLGRLGGLLKQTLASGFDAATIKTLLRQIDIRQNELKAAVRRI